MGSEDLKLLERKYWRGETTTVEEERLRAAAGVERSGLTESLRHLMMEVDDRRNVKLDENFEAEFWRVTKSKGSSRERRTAWIRWAAAIIVLLVLALVIKLSLHESAPTPVAEVENDTYDNPQVAFREVKRALMFTSNKLNDGTGPMMEIIKLDQAKKIVKTTVANKDTLN